MIDFNVRTADGGGQPESAIDNAYLKKDRLKVCYAFLKIIFESKYARVERRSNIWQYK